MSEIKYPATMDVHWPTGPTACCDDHAKQLVGLGNMLGSHIATTKLIEPKECMNCKNEAEDKENE